MLALPLSTNAIEINGDAVVKDSLKVDFIYVDDSTRIDIYLHQEDSDTSVFDATWFWAQNENINLNELGNIEADKSFNMSNKTLTWDFVNPAGGMVFNVSGAFSGDFIELQQQTGNPGQTHLLHAVAADNNVVGLHIEVTADTNSEFTGGTVYGDSLDFTQIKEGGDFVLAFTDTGATIVTVSDTTILSAQFATKQPLEGTLTDIADGTIAEDLVNTANPWADNEVADDLTASSYLPLAGGSVTGYTELGESSPAIKFKTFTGTTGASEGDLSSFAHGLTASKILMITAMVDGGSNVFVPPAFTRGNEFQYDVYVNGATNITLGLSATNSGNITSAGYKVTVMYEE